MLAATLPLNRHITYGAIFLAAAQLLFLYNLVRSLRRGAIAPPNPWNATTLEWNPALHPTAASVASDEKITVYRSPCEYQASPSGEISFMPQWSEDAVTDVKRE
jgi:cytochrome c oxidase subunit 1